MRSAESWTDEILNKCKEYAGFDADTCHVLVRQIQTEARNAGIEESAKVCDTEAGEYRHNNQDERKMAGRNAAAIRALKKD